MVELQGGFEYEDADCSTRNVDFRPPVPSRRAKVFQLLAMRLPIEDSIDLHTFAPRDVASVVEEYVTAACAAGLREIRLIHGRGRGVQRGIVQQVLDRHPLVVEFWDAPESHLGATVARLRGASEL
jgi:DNA-nicking Smr family endonuclease